MFQKYKDCKPVKNSIEKTRDYNIFFHTHTVTGIVISVGLYVIFLCGAFALFIRNIDNWEVNGVIRDHSSVIDYEKGLDIIEAMGYNMHGRNFFISNSEGPTFFYAPPLTDATLVKSILGILPDSVADGVISLEFDSKTFEKIEEHDEKEHAHLGEFIYGLHYFKPIPVIGQYLSGLVSLFFFFAILTGLIIHWKKIVRNFFTFRIKSSLKNLWTDAHAALGVIGLPFQLMYAITGAIFGMTILIFFPYGFFLYDMDQQTMMEDMYPSIQLKNFKSHGYSGERGNINSLISLSVNSVPEENRKGFQVYVKQYKDYNAHVGIFYITPPLSKNFMSSFESVYRLKDEQLVSEIKYGNTGSYSMGVIEFIHKLHFANYGNYLVKLVYFFTSLLTCFMIISGLMIWIKAREKKAFEKDKKINERIGRFSIGACVGLFPSLALLFVLVKVMPAEMANGFLVVTYIFAAFWGAYIIYSMWIKDYWKMTRHSFWIAGALGILIPVFNGLQSDLWLWELLKKGLIDSFFIDFSWLIMGIISMLIAYYVKPKAHPGKLVKTNSSATKNVSAHPEKSMNPEVLKPGPVVAINNKK